MTHTLPTSDLVRCILFNQPKGPNLARTMQGLASGRPTTRYGVWRETLSQRRRRVAVARWDGVELAGLASAHVRSGHRAWEVDQLYLADTPPHYGGPDRPQWDAPGVTLELLERIVQQAGDAHAERVFLRLPEDSPVFAAARRAGFHPSYEEVLLESRPGHPTRTLRPPATRLPAASGRSCCLKTTTPSFSSTARPRPSRYGPQWA